MDRITVYVPPELHRRLKAAARERGLTLSGFMLRAAERAVDPRGRAGAAARMDAVRQRIQGSFAATDIVAVREEGRR